MNTLMKKAGLGIALAATAMTAAAPADAQRYRRYNRGGGDVAAGAVLGGIVGLGLGAAIASNNRGRYYDRGYYPDRGYYADRGYYYNAPPRVIVRERYYAPPPRYYDRGYDDRGYYAGPGPRGGGYGYGYYGY